MKKLYEIEWPDSHGPEWLNEDNVQLVFNNYCRNVGVVVREIKRPMTICPSAWPVVDGMEIGCINDPTGGA